MTYKLNKSNQRLAYAIGLACRQIRIDKERITTDEQLVRWVEVSRKALSEDLNQTKEGMPSSGIRGIHLIRNPLSLT